MRKTPIALLAVPIIFHPLLASASLDNTHHDMSYLISSKEKCAYCHAKILGGNDDTYGKVGAFCVMVCHMAGTGPAAAGRAQVVPDNADFYTFDEAANGGTGAIATVATGILSPDGLKNGHQFDVWNIMSVAGEVGIATVTDTNWPHLTAAIGWKMECTTCHAVHDNTNPPFLNAPYAAAAGPYSSFCERCHITKTGNYGSTNDGNHPSGMSFNSAQALAYDGTNAKAFDIPTRMNGRTLRFPGSATAPAPANLYAGFTTIAVGATPQATANAAGTSWNLAGHVLETANAATMGLPVQNVGAGSANNRFGCYSCHNAHQNNQTPCIDEVLVAPRSKISNNVLTLGGGADTSDACYGCHGDTANPSDAGKSNFGHPVNNETVVSDVNGWVVPIAASAAIPSRAVFESGATDTPKCLACHDVHNGTKTGLMAIRNAAPPEGSACTACHIKSFEGDAEDMHHPGRWAVDFTQLPNGGFVNPAWTTVDKNGNLADGLSCPDCHIGDGNKNKRSTAHNWLP